MNNLNQIPSEIQNFALRYLVIEKKENMKSSWCSSDKIVTTTRSKPTLQYTLDGKSWYNVETYIESNNANN